MKLVAPTQSTAEESVAKGAGGPAAWLMAARPKTLVAAVAPVMIGTAMAVADDAAHLLSALAALMGAVFIQIGTNFCNDYCDFAKGADNEQRQGPTRAVQAGLISARAMVIATGAAFFVAGLFWVYLISRAGLPVVVIGVLAIASGVLYTAGPYPLAYLGLGDLFVLVFFGPVAVAGTYLVQTTELPSPAVVIAGLGPGLLSAGLLTVNNLRDVNEDRLAGKRTLAVRFGERYARIQYMACILCAAAVPPALVAWQGRGPYAVSATAVALLGIPTMRRVAMETGGPGLNPALGATARLLVLYSILFSVGWAL